MKSTFEEMGGTYIRVGDYFIPDLVLDDEPEYQIGKYGRMRERYLKEHRRAAYAELKLSGKLDAHLAEIDQTCNERMDTIIAQMKEREGVTEALKASDQMAWIGAMNNIRSRAEEIVLSEVVYA